MTEDELLQLRSFGRTSLSEVTQKLAELGLRLGFGADPVGSGAGEVVTEGTTAEL